MLWSPTGKAPPWRGPLSDAHVGRHPGRAPDMLRAFVLAVLIQMVAINSLIELGYLKITIPPFFGVATALSGLAFGLGMVLAVGCTGAILYRVGEGKLDYVFAMIAYAVSAWASNNWSVESILCTFPPVIIRFLHIEV